MIRTIGLIVGALILLGGTRQAWGQAFNPTYAHAYRLALKLKADSARILTAQPNPNQEQEAQRILIQSLADLMGNIVSENDEAPKGYYDRQDERIEVLDDMDYPGPWARHALAECYMHRGLSQGRYGQELRAALSVIKAYRKTKDLFEDEPNFLPARKSMGLYEVVLGMGPVERNWLLRLARLSGSVDSGLAYLKTCSDRPNAQQAEATLLYSLVQMYLRGEPEKGRAALLRYVNNEHDDLAGLTILANVYKHDQDHGRALAAVRAIQRDKSHLPFYYPLMLEGELYLQALQPDSAIPKLEHYLAVSGQKRFVKSLHYQLFIAYYLKNDSAEANSHFLRISTEGEVGVEGDRYAQYFFYRGLIPDKRLLKARLLFDGGFNERAKGILDSVDRLSLKTKYERTELCYRRARLFQRMKDSVHAQSQFNMAVILAEDDPSYFAPMSCLQLGQMAFRARKWDEASEWFERVKTYPKHEYKDGLDERAEAWLKKVKKARKG